MVRRKIICSIRLQTRRKKRRPPVKSIWAHRSKSHRSKALVRKVWRVYQSCLGILIAYALNQANWGKTSATSKRLRRSSSKKLQSSYVIRHRYWLISWRFSTELFCANSSIITSATKNWLMSVNICTVCGACLSMLTLRQDPPWMQSMHLTTEQPYTSTTAWFQGCGSTESSRFAPNSGSRSRTSQTGVGARRIKKSKWWPLSSS